MSEKQIILIAEDNDFVRMQVVRYLNEAGYETREATDGETALDVMESADVALAIVDLRMEPVDGFEFIRIIRGLGKDTPVILITGDNNPDILEQSATWGVRTVLIKPVQKDRLISAVRRLIEADRKGEA